MKAHKNLPIYLLSAALLFVGVTSMSPAQGATSTSGQILALQKQVKALNSNLIAAIGLVNFAEMQLGDRITSLENKPQSLRTETINFLAPQFGHCPGSSYGPSVVTGVSWNSYSTYNPLTVSTESFQSCRITVNVP